VKLKSLLKTFPWDKTLEALCREPPEESALLLAHAQQLIAQQRESQLAVLSRMMHSPVLEGDYARAEGAFAESDDPQVALLRLRSPDQTSRLFLAVAAQAGKILRPFESERLSGLNPEDAALGRLLLVLSVAQSSPKSRAAQAHEWPEIARQGIAGGHALPFGPVLTPMLVTAEPDAWVASHGIYPDFAWELAEELRETTSSDKLTDWTRRLVYAGAARLRRLSRGGERGEFRAPGRLSRDVELGESSRLDT
jgi:hypothetical protein